MRGGKDFCQRETCAETSRCETCSVAGTWDLIVDEN